MGQIRKPKPKTEIDEAIITEIDEAIRERIYKKFEETKYDIKL